jgi:hypothetical protein
LHSYFEQQSRVLSDGQDGGVVLGRLKVWMLAYADDVVLLAKDVREMNMMLKRTERYMDRRDLRVNVEKTKWMMFRKRGGGTVGRGLNGRGKSWSE